MTGWATGSKGPGYMGDVPSAEGEPEEARNAIKALKDVEEEIKKLRDPTGTKDAPGRTCHDLLKNNPEITDGWYFVDPNGGGISDSFEAECLFNGKRTETCLHPIQTGYERQQWFTRKENPEAHVWFAETFDENGFFNYGVHRSQVKYLHQMSSRARQDIAFSCKNTVIIADQAPGNNRKAIRLGSFDEEIMGPVAKKPYRFRVKSDTCMTSNGQLGQTIIEVRGRGQRVERMPIMDVGLYDVGGEDQEFGIEIGPACFS